jgi:hypothetical protein
MQGEADMKAISNRCKFVLSLTSLAMGVAHADQVTGGGRENDEFIAQALGVRNELPPPMQPGAPVTQYTEQQSHAQGMVATIF